MRWQNAQLNTSLAQARAARDQLEAEAGRPRGVAAPGSRSSRRRRAGLGEAGAPARAARGQRAAADGRDRAQADAAARLAEMRASAGRTGQGAPGERSASVEEQLATAKEQRAAARQEGAQRWQGSAALEDERDELARPAGSRRPSREAANAQLEVEVAGAARGGGQGDRRPRQNLLAVESQIKELNEALMAAAPAAGGAPGLILRPDWRRCAIRRLSSGRRPAGRGAPRAVAVADQAARRPRRFRSGRGSRRRGRRPAPRTADAS